MLNNAAKAVAVTILLLSSPLTAQEIDDDSGSTIGRDIQEDLFTAARDQMLDGYSARFSRLSVKRDSLCGFVNGKNAFGAYVGHTPFYMDLKTKRLSFLPPANDPLHELSSMTFNLIGCATFRWPTN